MLYHHTDHGELFEKAHFEKKVQDALNSNLFSNFKFNPEETPLHSLALFEQKMRKMLFGMFRGTQNASELLPNLPFWLNSEKRCVEPAIKMKMYPNQTLECWPNCMPVKWEDALLKAFAFNSKSEYKFFGMTNVSQYFNDMTEI